MNNEIKQVKTILALLAVFIVVIVLTIHITPNHLLTKSLYKGLYVVVSLFFLFTLLLGIEYEKVITTIRASIDKLEKRNIFLKTKLDIQEKTKEDIIPGKLLERTFNVKDEKELSFGIKWSMSKNIIKKTIYNSQNKYVIFVPNHLQLESFREEERSSNKVYYRNQWIDYNTLLVDYFFDVIQLIYPENKVLGIEIEEEAIDFELIHTAVRHIHLATLYSNVKGVSNGKYLYMVTAKKEQEASVSNQPVILPTQEEVDNMKDPLTVLETAFIFKWEVTKYYVLNMFIRHEGYLFIHVSEEVHNRFSKEKAKMANYQKYIKEAVCVYMNKYENCEIDTEHSYLYPGIERKAKAQQEVVELGLIEGKDMNKYVVIEVMELS